MPPTGPLQIGCNRICFTGETKTGEEIVRLAAVKKVLLEEGGLGRLVILDDANFQKVVEDAVFGCYYNVGQRCVANERILAHERIHDRFADAVVARSREVKLGNPFEVTSDIGPLNNEPQAQKVERHLEDGVEKGAKVVLGGKRATGFPSHLYFQPAVVDNVTPDMLFNREETFGPVAPILTFVTVDEAIDIANSTLYGLSASVHTNDLNTAFYLADRLKVGQVVINDTISLWEYQHPWGGAKKS